MKELKRTPRGIHVGDLIPVIDATRLGRGSTVHYMRVTEKPFNIGRAYFTRKMEWSIPVTYHGTTPRGGYASPYNVSIYWQEKKNLHYHWDKKIEVIRP